MKFLKEYPAYKDSGVEWLGEIPEQWEVKKLKWLFSAMGSGTTPSSSNESYYGEGLPWINTGDFNDDFINEIPKSVTEKALKDHSVLKIYPVGTLLVALYGATIGKLGILTKPCTINQACFAMGKPLGIDTKFVFYWFLGNRNNIIAMSYGGGQPNISGNTIRNLRLTVPPATEQQAIADFLDRRTGAIDKLIGKKERVIELLREKRTAIISHAVTKGLDPDAKMKDSRIDWLGEIPEHWEIKRLRHLIKGALANGLFKKKEYFGTGVKLVNVFDIYRDDFLVDIDSLERVDANEGEIKNYAVESGDIFFVRSSLKLEGIGKSVCIFDVAEPTVFECHVVRARPNTDQILPAFLINYLNSTITTSRLISLANMVTMTTLDQIKIKDIEVAVPPIVEQVAIAKYLKQEYFKTATLICKVTEAIEKLKEYRTALISAAVTGKIDVREV